MAIRAVYLQMGSIVIVVIGMSVIGFLYSTEPRSMAEVVSKAQVTAGTYQINQSEFNNGLASFRRDDFNGAEAAFERADPEKRDANVQFYIAYSYYRQGWGRLSNDDALFSKGLAAVDRVIALDPNYRSSDAALQMRSATELKTELEEGLKVTASDFNPLRLVRERK